MSEMEKVREMEIIPVSDKAIFNTVMTRECGRSYKIPLEIEEDLLVPDTEPDMDQIYNTSASVSEISFHSGEKGGIVRGEVMVEALYRSAEGYSNKMVLLQNKIPFKKECTDKSDSRTDISVRAEVISISCRVINERKYRVKISLSVHFDEIINNERNFFEGVQERDLEFLKDDACIMSLLFSKTKEIEIEENLAVNNEKIRPLKIIKSSFVAAENHRQLTSDKLVINQSIWVRIIYEAELASQGNLSNQPMYYTGKIDSTQFIPLGSDQEAVACRVLSDVSGLTAKVSDAADGFVIKGIVKTKADFFGSTSCEMVVDFYDMNEDMTCDNKEENVCSGMETVIIEQAIRDSIDLGKEPLDAANIVYTDASILEYDIRETGVNSDGNFNGSEAVNASLSKAEITGRLQAEILIMVEDGNYILVKKVCDFSMTAELSAGNMTIAASRIFVREMDADISAGRTNISVQLQAELNLCSLGTVRVISNPCIIRESGREKIYPLVIYTAREGDSMWDVAKRYRVPANRICELNGIDALSPGMKIVVAK